MSPMSPSIRTQTFKGKPCKRGHSGVRYQTNGQSGGGCVECARQRARERKARLKAQLEKADV